MPSIPADAKCILITGATSGIGRALALELSKLPSKPKIIATGRRKERLEEMKNKGLCAEFFELPGSMGNADAVKLKASVEDLVRRYPDLDAVILNAGIQHQFKVKTQGIDMNRVIEEMNINYVSVVGFISAILPHFLELERLKGRPSFIATVTSGLAIVPLALVPNYSATKAALSSFTTSLRAQLDETMIQVIEILPPLVESELHDAYNITPVLSKSWMPQAEFIRATMEGLKSGANHIPVGTAKELWEKYNQEGKYDSVLQMRKVSDTW